MTPIRVGMFSVRTASALDLAGIKTVEELALISDAEFLRTPNIGRKSLKEIRMLTDTDTLQITVNALLEKYGCYAVLTAITKAPEIPDPDAAGLKTASFIGE